MVTLPLLRLSVASDERNGLRKPSQVMIDKPSTVSRDKIGSTFAIASDTVMLSHQSRSGAVSRSGLKDP